MYEYQLYENIIIGKNHYISYKKDNETDINQDNKKFSIIHHNNIKVVWLIISQLDFKNNITPKDFVFEKGYDYKIEVNLDIDDNIQCPLYVVTYQGKNKIYKETILPNEISEITNLYNGEYIRLSFRALGEGNININSIKIYRRKSIETIPYEDFVRHSYSKIESISKLKIACIFDPFTMSCYEDMCELIPVNVNTFKFDLKDNRPHLLIVESAWKGNNEQWTKMVQYINKYNTQKLQELVMWCKQNQIPTVFWNKEDPVHYQHFVETAKIFDYVFTTDENTVSKYKNELNHNNVYSLPFAAQPKIHNPIKVVDERIEKACFAGSFHNNKYPERKKNLEMILNLAKNNFDLDIYDRNFNSQLKQYKFPDEFSEYIKGYLPVHELDKVNKRYKIMLNINTVTDSPTMFSRRVFEALACATPVISGYSMGINKVFNGLVVSNDNEAVLKEELVNLMNKSYYEMKKIKGIREVLSKHTYYHRLNLILDKVGIQVNHKDKTVAMISIIESMIDFKKVKTIYDHQEYTNKSLYLLTKNIDIYKAINDNYKDVDIILIDENSLNNYLDINEDYVSVISIDNYYGRYYLTDLINATLYANAEFIGKKCYLTQNSPKVRIFKANSNINIINKNMEFEYVDSLYLDRCIIKSNIFSQVDISLLMEYIYMNSIDNFRFGYRYFSIDRFNFIENFKSFNVNLTDIEI